MFIFELSKRKINPSREGFRPLAGIMFIFLVSAIPLIILSPIPFCGAEYILAVSTVRNIFKNRHIQHIYANGADLLDKEKLYVYYIVFLHTAQQKIR